MKSKTLHILLLLYFTAVSAFFCVAQQQSANKKSQQYYNKSLQHLQSNDYQSAIDFLKKSVTEDPTFATAYQQLGDIYRRQRLYDEAIYNYQQVLALDASLTPLTLFGLGESLLHCGRYTEAIFYLEQYRNIGISEKSRIRVDKYLSDCRFSLNNPQHSPYTHSRLPATINTSNDEYFPQLTADQQMIIFTRKENNTENFYQSEITADSTWSVSKKLTGDVNSGSLNEGAHCISPDGRYLFFTGCNRPGGLGSCDIYVAEKENGHWSSPTNLGAPVNTKGWEAQPSISADGKTLYFVSNRAGGIGGYDIWKTELLENGKWGTPVNLGKNINTPYDENSPYIHADNKTLYFSSDGWPGYGGKDLFVSRSDTTGHWSMPTNLGKPINDHLEQRSLHVSMNGHRGFYSSEDSTDHQLDIYQFELAQAIQPWPIAYIAGTVLDAETRQPLTAIVSVTDTETQDVIFDDQSDYEDGKFIAPLALGQNYAVQVQAQGYLFDSRQYNLTYDKLKDEKFTTEILLSPIKHGNTARLGNIYFDTNKAELLPSSTSDLQLLLNFLKTNPNTVIEIGGHTDSTGDKASNQVLSEQRAQSVAAYLIQHHVGMARIQSKGYGDQYPVADNTTTEGKQLNRRTEIKVLH